jgi:hypothetical protein
MRAGFLTPVPPAGTPTTTAWPVPPALCGREALSAPMRRAKGQLRVADELGCDWVSVAAQHSSPRLLPPGPLSSAGA